MVIKKIKSNNRKNNNNPFSFNNPIIITRIITSIIVSIMAMIKMSIVITITTLITITKWNKLLVMSNSNKSIARCSNRIRTV